MARPTTTSKKGRVHKGATSGSGIDAGEVNVTFRAMVQEPEQDTRGYYLGKTVKLGGRKISMQVADLPKKLQEAIPAEWHNEEVKGGVSLFINIPDAEREETFRWSGGKDA